MIVKEKIGGLFFDLIQGDTLIENEYIKDGSVDLIITDLPYGTVGESMQDDTEKYKIINESKWDNVIDTNKIMQTADRILRKNGKMILTAQQPFTTELISKAIPNLPFSYTIFWDKLHFANCLGANKACVNYMEECLLFSKNNPKHDLELKHPIRKWLKEIQEKANIFWNDKRLINEYVNRKICKNEQSAKVTLKHLLDWNYVQIQKITKKHYEVLNKFFEFDKREEEIIKIFETYQEQHLKEQTALYGSTFNLWEGNKYKSNILKYKKDYDGHHPTQKPVLLLEDLIKTFSNENDLIVDLTMGSGSTGVACKNLNRNFIGIELDENYFNTAKERIENA